MYTDNINNIKNKEDFLKFLSLFRENLENDKKSWTNSDLESFLDAMGDWIEDMEGYYINMNIDLPKHINWRVFADVLCASKVYE